MGKAECLKNIENKSPPAYCGDTLCGRIQGKINEYCKHAGLGGDVPVPQSPESGDCWCCCSCLAWGTPIEVEPNLYMQVEKIESGRSVLTTGGQMEAWVPQTVTDVGGIAPGSQLDFCYTLLLELEDQQVRTLVSTADHLYLLPDRTLKSVQDLRPGDKVMQADGGQATVKFSVSGQFSGGVRNFSLGPFDPKAHPYDPYEGHLINSFGIVTADLAVQMAFYQGSIDALLLAPDEPDLPQIGSTRFFERYDTVMYEQFVRTPEMWPADFVPQQPSLFNIPASALAYFTPGQADDLYADDDNQNLGNSQAIANFKYLRTLFNGFFPNNLYAADWSNPSPNAWYFNSAGQNFIILTGGMLRLKTLDVHGLALVLSHLSANADGYGCTGDADYWGAALTLREVWYGSQFLEYLPKARKQMAATFALVSAGHAEPHKVNLCKSPGLACRLSALEAAGSFDDIPACVSHRATFAVTGATATMGAAQEIAIEFSSTLLAPTASPPGNYQLDGDVVVLQAQLQEDQKCVVLSVDGLLPSTGYKLVVNNVVSNGGQFLGPDQNSVKFRTE